MGMRRLALVLALVALAAGTPFAGGAAVPDGQLPPWAPTNGPTPLATGDFNGDGYDDLATGVPSEDISGTANTGAVHVLYGGTSGVTGTGNQFWHQGSPGVPGKLQRDDRFGWALTTGDFDNDGYDDLAVGVPFEDIGVRSCSGIFNQNCRTTTWTDAGYVVVLYGTANGLSRAGSDGWARNTGGVQGSVDGGVLFGWALAAGDFDGDGFDDLGIGAPGESRRRGAVNVLRGGPNGLRASGDQLWRQGKDGVDEGREEGDWFGASLAAGKLGYSTREDDLAIGAPGEAVGGKTRAGVVHVLYGQAGEGLSASIVPDSLLHHDVAGVAGDVQSFGLFGGALASADFGRSNQADLAVGAPGYLIEGRTGAVSVFYGSSYGVVPAESELWHRGTLGLPSTAVPLRFGHSLAAADFNGFSQADLAIGAHHDRSHDTLRAGSVAVVYGSPIGLRVSGSIATAPQLLTRRTFVNVQPRVDDRFGSAIAAGNFGGGPGADIAVSAPGVDSGDTAAQVDTGAIYLGYGQSTGIFTQGPTFWNQDTAGILDDAEAGDRLGGG